jgi:hypothetical protein
METWVPGRASPRSLTLEIPPLVAQYVAGSFCRFEPKVGTTESQRFGANKSTGVKTLTSVKRCGL